MRQSPKILSPAEALAKAESLCVRAEHCTFEIRQKLSRWKIPPEDCEKIIESLIRDRFIDDERFARSYVNDKIRFSRWGERKIEMELLKRRIPRALITQILKEYDKSVIESNLKLVLEAKARTLDDPYTFEGRTRLFRYAVSRGYYPAAVAEVIKSLYKSRL